MFLKGPFGNKFLKIWGFSLAFYVLLYVLKVLSYIFKITDVLHVQNVCIDNMLNQIKSNKIKSAQENKTEKCIVGRLWSLLLSFDAIFFTSYKLMPGMLTGAEKLKFDKIFLIFKVIPQEPPSQHKSRFVRTHFKGLF